MPNIAAVLRAEISRLSRKEVRSQVDATKKATTQHRRHIATLKRQVAQLERQVALLSRKVLDTPQAVSTASTTTRPRFVAKGLRSQRKRLGFNPATDYGKLLAVSAQTIYNWERELASPRTEQLSRLAALRGTGKRQAAERLKQLRSVKGPSPRNQQSNARKSNWQDWSETCRSRTGRVKTSVSSTRRRGVSRYCSHEAIG